jgi:hypothetical protein
MAWRNYKSGNKYHSHKVIIAQDIFDSKKEARRWLELKNLESHGLISGLERQKKFLLIPAQHEPDSVGPRGGKIKGKLIEREVAYYADFYYFDELSKKFVVEDTKSPATRTEAYILKRKMMLSFYGIRINEV